MRGDHGVHVLQSVGEPDQELAYQVASRLRDVPAVAQNLKCAAEVWIAQVIIGQIVNSSRAQSPQI